MKASTDVIPRLNLWHNTAVATHHLKQSQQAETRKLAEATADKELYKKTLDSFTTNFEAISKFDETSFDGDPRPGNVKVGTESLLKTAEGFEMQVTGFPLSRRRRDPLGPPSEPPRAGENQIKEEFIVNEKSGTITYTKHEIVSKLEYSKPRYSSHGSYMAPSLSPTRIPVLLDSFTLDLNNETLLRKGDGQA